MSTSQNDLVTATSRTVLGVGLVTFVAFLIGIASQHVFGWSTPKRALAVQHDEFAHYDKDKYWAGKIRAGGYIL